MTLEVNHIYPPIIRGIFFALFLVSCSPEHEAGSVQKDKLFHIQGEAQGTYYSVKYLADKEYLNKQDFDLLFKRIDSSLSTYQSYSLITRFNQEDSLYSSDEWFNSMIEQSQMVYEATEGAFDPTVLPLVRAWGFGPEGRTYRSEEEPNEIKERVGWEKLEILNSKPEEIFIRKGLPGMELDFNAIAQGYASDILATELDVKGINNYLIDTGGELKAKGKNAENKIWSIGIDRPVDGERELQAILSLENSSVATSGNYRKYYVEDGVKYAHTISPFTGEPVTHSLLSATVVSDSCSIADAYATAMMVLGLEKAKELIERKGNIEAYLIYSDEQGEYKTWVSDGLRSSISEDL